MFYRLALPWRRSAVCTVCMTTYVDDVQCAEVSRVWLSIFFDSLGRSNFLPSAHVHSPRKACLAKHFRTRGSCTLVHRSSVTTTRHTSGLWHDCRQGAYGIVLGMVEMCSCICWCESKIPRTRWRPYRWRQSPSAHLFRSEGLACLGVGSCRGRARK